LHKKQYFRLFVDKFAHWNWRQAIFSLSLFVFITPVEIKRTLFGIAAFSFGFAGSWRAVSGYHSPSRQAESPLGYSSYPGSENGFRKSFVYWQLHISAICVIIYVVGIVFHGS